MTQERNRHIFIFTGPTGGHFFPAKSVGSVFRSRCPDTVIHVFVNRLPKFVSPGEFSNGLQLHVTPFDAPNSRSFGEFFRCCMGYATAFGMLILFYVRFRPRVVLGFGSYGSAIGVIIAFLFRIPIVLHEQNAVLGRANAFLGRFAHKTGLSFPMHIQGNDEGKFFYSGYPLRPGFRPTKEREGVEPGTAEGFKILVFGGSQGARKLNDVVIAAFELMSPEERSFFAVTHIVGSDGTRTIEDRYRTLGIRSAVYGFTDKISDHLKRSDCVIARAGAGTIFELAAVGRAAILVPYPHANGHQRINARALMLRDAAWVIEESHLSGDFLCEIILRLRVEHAVRDRLASSIGFLDRLNAAEELVKTGEKFLGRA